jgi:GTP cyclohydrolase IA
MSHNPTPATVSDEDIEQGVRNLIQYVGDDPTRPGVLETPARVRKAWRTWCSGYSLLPADILKTFEDGAELCTDGILLVKDIELYSHCEHHMAPFFGVAHVAYIPDQRVVGLSKLARLVDLYARRLQVQERLTNQIANAIHEHLAPKGVGVVVVAKHFCMCSRGVQKQGGHTVYSALRGAMMDDAATRAEFFRMCGM